MGRVEKTVTGPARVLLLGFGLFLSLAGFQASAQVYPFRRFGPVDGLPHSFAYTVTQDDRGYLWIGTFGGLARYDGERFLTISTKDGLPGDDVRAILQDRQGRLFVAADRGVARLERRASGALHVGAVPPKVFGVAEGLPSPAARALVEDAEGAIWVATRDGGVARLGENGVALALRTGKELPSSTAWCGARDARGRLWFGTRGDGVFRLDGRTVVRFSLAEGLPDPNVFDLKVDPKGTLFAATTAGVARFDEEAKRFVFVPYGADASTAVSSLAFDASGTMWVGRYGRGVAKVTPSGTTILREEQGLPSDFVTGLFVDREGSLWITMQGGGLAQFASDRFAAYDRTAGWPGGAADAFALEPEGAVWAGSFGRGAVRID
ncbi:MAG TPA: two-component regulator propeller domain-containing protein, partial [Thermoanaerobaculia bacterium]|nr:two-component regulator propeller domain-containing protein [Thermoanaerobaculia bacterium]